MGLLGKIFGKEKEENKKSDGFMIASPLQGRVLALSEVKDEVFSSGVLGPGVAIEPSEGKVVSPADGEVASLFPTKHAVGIRTREGVEILIHIGLDTVELEGKYFHGHVEQGQTVKKGQTLVTFDLEKIREAGYVTQVPVLLTNLGNYEKMQLVKNTEIGYGQELMMLS